MKRRHFIILTSFCVFAALMVAAGVLYWEGLKDSPEYSLALLVDALKTSDDTKVRALVNTDAIVDDFVPQITGKAVELYGRGLPGRTLDRVGSVAAPLMPAVKQKARKEIPGMIRRETGRFADVPFAAMVLGAGRYLTITRVGETASVSSKLPEHKFEVIMRRNSDGWQVVGVRDDELAEEIARAIGEQIIAAASGKRIDNTSGDLGINQINELLRRAEEALR